MNTHKYISELRDQKTNEKGNQKIANRDYLWMLTPGIEPGVAHFVVQQLADWTKLSSDYDVLAQSSSSYTSDCAARVRFPTSKSRDKHISRFHSNLDPVDLDSKSRRSISCGILLFASLPATMGHHS